MHSIRMMQAEAVDKDCTQVCFNQEVVEGWKLLDQLGPVVGKRRVFCPLLQSS